MNEAKKWKQLNQDRDIIFDCMHARTTEHNMNALVTIAFNLLNDRFGTKDSNRKETQQKRMRDSLSEKRDQVSR